MKINPWLFKWHRRFALLAFIPLLVICITGSLLVFKHELNTLLMNDKVNVPSIGKKRLALDTLYNSAQATLDNSVPVGWVIFANNPARADVVFVMPKGTNTWQYTTIDQYSGKVLATPTPLDHYLMDWLLSLHQSFLLHDAGLFITLFFALTLLFISITGFVLYRHFWKSFFTLRWNSRLLVYFSDLHKMMGIISSPVLFILAITGGYFNIVHLLHEYQEHQGDFEHHKMTGPLFNTKLSLDNLVQQSRDAIDGFTPTYISLPHEPEATINIHGDNPSNMFLLSEYGSSLSFNSETGAVVSIKNIQTQPGVMQLLDSFRKLHFGHFAGITSKIFWSVLGGMPLILSVTGITMWYQRRKKRQSKLVRQTRIEL